jgi:hypothetical protein
VCATNDQCPTGTGACQANDRELDLLSPLGGSFYNETGCHMPRISCQARGMSTDACACLDSMTACVGDPDCGGGCQIPDRHRLGLDEIPYALVSLNSAGGVSFALGSPLGVRLSPGFRSDLLNASIPETNLDVRGIAVGRLDSDANDDLAFFSGGSCTQGGSYDRVCPVVGMGTVGCVGVVMVGGGDSNPQPKTGGCRRFAIDMIPEAICLADMNGDGFLDIVLASGDQDSLSVLAGNGQGGFRAQPVVVPLPAGLHGGPIVCRDLDGDGRADVAVAGRDDGKLAVILRGP